MPASPCRPATGQHGPAEARAQRGGIALVQHARQHLARRLRPPARRLLSPGSAAAMGAMALSLAAQALG